MARSQTTAELRRALLHVIAAVDRLHEVAGPFPLIEQDLHAALEILGEPLDRPADDVDEQPGAG